MAVTEAEVATNQRAREFLSEPRKMLINRQWVEAGVSISAIAAKSMSRYTNLSSLTAAIPCPALQLSSHLSLPSSWTVTPLIQKARQEA